eukprot:GHVU01068231.1.p1 GENE.GHVU01068231.1~~GHVU01068231.1.p1  ORF type:complete len:266 (-),score=4.25 GHVU01068231.1:593-1390(-)
MKMVNANSTIQAVATLVSIVGSITHPQIPSFTFSNHHAFVGDGAEDSMAVTRTLEERCSCPRKCNSRCYNVRKRIMCNDCNCAMGSDSSKCTNRRFGDDTRFKLVVRSSGVSGYGVFAEEPIPLGGFLGYYIGEVMSIEAWNTRTTLYDSLCTSVRYTMGLDGVYDGNRTLPNIDAQYIGNHVRFINHSCEPNCQFQQWDVNGRWEICLVSLWEIDASEELTAHYGAHRSKMFPVCMCASCIRKNTMRIRVIPTYDVTLKANEFF